MLGGSTTFIAELLRSLIFVSTAFSPFIGLVYPLVLIITAIIVNGFFIRETYRNAL